MLSRLIATVGLAALEGELTAYARRTRRRVILTAVAILFWLIAVAFAIAALTVWLATAIGALWACAIVAGVSALIALVLQVIAASLKRRPRPSATLSRLLEEVGKDGDGTAFGLIAIVAVAGYLLGRNFLRR